MHAPWVQLHHVPLQQLPCHCRGSHLSESVLQPLSSRIHIITRHGIAQHGMALKGIAWHGMAHARYGGGIPVCPPPSSPRTGPPLACRFAASLSLPSCQVDGCASCRLQLVSLLVWVCSPPPYLPRDPAYLPHHITYHITHENEGYEGHDERIHVSQDVHPSIASATTMEVFLCLYMHGMSNTTQYQTTPFNYRSRLGLVVTSV